jgi:hypothetical protein
MLVDGTPSGMGNPFGTSFGEVGSVRQGLDSHCQAPGFPERCFFGFDFRPTPAHNIARLVKTIKMR